MDPGKVMSNDHRHRSFSNDWPARHGRRTAREKAKEGLRFAYGLWGDHPSAEGEPLRANWNGGLWGFECSSPKSRTSSTWGCITAGLRRVRGHTSSDAAGPGGSDAMKTGHPNQILQAFPDWRRSNSRPMWNSGDGEIRGNSGGDQRPHLTEIGVSQRRSFHSQNASRSRVGSARPRHKCHRSGPGAGWRHQHRTWAAGRVGHKHRGPEAWTMQEEGARPNWGN